MNVAVVRSHFKALIENPDTYSKSLHKNYKETYPDLDVTAQRVLDQKRTIFNRACTNTSGTGRAKNSTTRGFHKQKLTSCIQGEMVTKIIGLHLTEILMR